MLQAATREWTRAKKMDVFRNVRAQLTPHNFMLNEQQVVNEGKLDLLWQLSGFLPEIQNQILTILFQFTWLTTLYLSGNQLMTIPASIRNIETLTLLNLQNNPLLPNGETPDQWGVQNLWQHFGDRVYISNPTLEIMPTTTTEFQVYGALDDETVRVSREKLTALRLPDIQVDTVFSVDDMLETLAQIVTSLNLTDEQKSAYLSYEVLANDFASDANNTAVPLTNVEKIWTLLMPRLTAYIRGLYGVPLAATDVRLWTMYASQIPEIQKVLTYIFSKIRDAADADSQALLFYQLVNGLLHCPTGQAEGINAVAYALVEGGYRADDFVGRLNHHLAVKKNNAFTQAILTKGVDSTQNVHLISTYRDRLKDVLGLSDAISSFTEQKIGTCGADPFADNMWNVVQVFYGVVSPNRLLDWVTDICQQTPPATSSATSSSSQVQASHHLLISLPD